MADGDFIRDVFDRIDAALDRPLPTAARHKLDRELRAAWAGERVYIGQDMAAASLSQNERHRGICCDRKRGDSLAVIAHRYGISRQRVHQILKAYCPES